MDCVVLSAINKALASNSTFYAYRLPGDRHSHFSAVMKPLDQTDATSGFRIVPFDQKNFNHITIPKGINAHDFCELDIEICNNISLLSADSFAETAREEYSKEFNLCLNKLKNKELDKIVLSKIIKCHNPNIDWGSAFMSMADCYPNAFVFIFNSQETGGWAGASPETLARYHNNSFSTMALAGTKPSSDSTEWGLKEQLEQEYVAHYIDQILQRNGIEYEKSEKFTLEAGSVSHICNKFTANVQSSATATKLVSELHPTPALCGLPTETAANAITQIERHHRALYGGYIGPFTPNGFDFFVNLRSLMFDKHSQALFCGGGLTIDSEEEKEWIETENKSMTMKRILQMATKK